jgi:DNA integrity scanning protein DisA with diadenylate cyclase activity
MMMMASEWNQIIGTVKAIGVWDILDIVIVAVLIYQVIKLIRETRAMQLAKGLILLLLLYFVAYNLNMKTVRFIMQNVVATGVLALVIVFADSVVKEKGKELENEQSVQFFSRSVYVTGRGLKKGRIRNA